MAITDIRVNVSLLSNRKYRKLKRRIGTEALEHLVSLWAQVALQSPSGELSGWASSDVEDAAGWTGEPRTLFDALRDCGFIDNADGLLKVHDWETHQHWIVGAPKRSESARKVNEIRWERERRKQEAEAASETGPNRIGFGSDSDHPRTDSDSDIGKGREGHGKALPRGENSNSLGKSIDMGEGRP
ncbi:MAG: hypothetical protein HZB55_23400 [Deltaproteobacteria bacterium]|nr:hypothetical protein [Deltaproteobacteria bacterium]